MIYLFITFFSGILMGMTTAPIGAWFLGWLALAPLWILVIQQKKSLDKFVLGLTWGIGYHGLALFWITGIHPMTWLEIPWLASLAVALFCWIFITVWGASLVAIWAYLFGILTPVSFSDKISSFARVLLGITLWCCLEKIWSLGNLWWTSLAFTQSNQNLVILHLGQLSGPITITVAIVTVNALFGEAFIQAKSQQNPGNFQQIKFWQKQNNPEQLNLLVKFLFSYQILLSKGTFSTSSLTISPSPHPSISPSPHLHKIILYKQHLVSLLLSHFFLLAIITLIFFHIIGFSLYNTPLNPEPEAALKVGIIQGNIPNEIKFNSQGWYRALEGYTQGYKKLAEENIDAVLTPETALPFLWTNQNNRRFLSFYQAILEKEVVAWVGGYGKQDNNLTNSLFTIDKTGEIFSRYDKIKLVPLGEYIPFNEVLGKLIDRLSPLDAHLVPGKTNQIFDTPFGKAIVGICYDSAFSEVFQRQTLAGGEFILTAANNAHYSSIMPAQHHAQDIMRAIENDRWAVRATNTGYSGIVDPHGRTIWLSGINTYETYTTTIYRRNTQTLYVKWGDWLTPVLLVGGVLTKIILWSKIK
ncbi:MAG: apolipoprotein N-acyltransferase [Okeania sp. SIO2F4]|uniref:apolipoprotein N-acyltransferase n=1 Tax=Okeania sp. SIO2F4 TaxID=2607790 RepID=UPI00142ADD94|nr:apolipoprotein N-acyltransferase [Okeania sp. SIO2F4]NES03914.1 apolipoprotein N-acyltransferase [Okeania sp. SIO2F4]